MAMTRFGLVLLGVLLLGALLGSAFLLGLSVGNDKLDEIQTPTRFSEASSTTSDSMTSVSEEQLEIIRQRFPNITEEQIDNFRDRFTGQMAQGDPGQGFRPDGISGKIEGIQDRIISLTTSQGQLEIVTNSDTKIQRLSEITLDNLESGLNITIIGLRQESGQIEASTILVTPDGTGIFQDRRR